MIDHIGFPVSDYARSKAFYAQALAPLGYGLVIEIDGAHTESRAARGRGSAPPVSRTSGIGAEGGLKKPLHVAIVAADRASVDAFHVAALASSGWRETMAAPGLRPHYHANYYAAFVLRSRRPQH